MVYGNQIDLRKTKLRKFIENMENNPRRSRTFRFWRLGMCLKSGLKILHGDCRLPLLWSARGYVIFRVSRTARVNLDRECSAYAAPRV